MQHKQITASRDREFTHSRAHFFEREEPVRKEIRNETREINNNENNENQNKKTEAGKIETEKTLTSGENIIIQCIASGVIIILVLLISLVDIPPALTIQRGIRFALTGANTPSELINNIQEFRENWLNWEGIQFTPVPGYPALEPPLYPYPIYPNAQPNINNSDNIEYYSMTAEGEESNPQIPEPSVVLELWD